MKILLKGVVVVRERVDMVSHLNVVEIR